MCREAGALVPVNAKLRDMNVEVRADDEQAIEVLASQMAVDITVRSPLTSTGLARPGDATTDGAVLVRARADKEAKYTELLQGNRCHLVGLETGGRWSSEANTFFDLLAAGCARGPLCLARIHPSGMAAQVDEDAGNVMRPLVCGFSGLQVGHVEGNWPDLADLFGEVTSECRGRVVGALDRREFSS